MMPAGKLARMVLRNTVRSPKHFALSAFGIVFGIGAFVFFLSLSSQASQTLQKVFPSDEVKVVAKQVAVAGYDLSKKLDDSTVAEIQKHPHVKSAVPRMALKFQSAGSGTFEKHPVNFPVGGFADGIDPAFVVASNPKLAAEFKDWDAEPPGKACVPRPSKREPPLTGKAKCDALKKQTDNCLADLATAGSGSAAGSGSGSAAGSGSGSAVGSGSGSAGRSGWGAGSARATMTGGSWGGGSGSASGSGSA
jgi:uncharacterized membrane protein YgcG